MVSHDDDRTFQKLLSLRSRRERDRAALFLSEGWRFLIQAAAHDAVENVIVTPSAAGRTPHAQVLAALRRKSIPITRIDESRFEALSFSHEPSGVAVVAKQRWNPLPAPAGLRDGCWVSFEAVRSPGNLGTVLRTADAMGATGAILVGPDVDPYDPRVVRASMGSIFSQRLTRETWPALRSWARSARVLVVGTSSHAECDYREVCYRRPIVLAMGCEREGLSQERLDECDVVVRIPMVGTADSLNVATAASILLYEVYRQRRPAGKPKRIAI
jgi:RNA methyltransferase, TrmH family